jgi:hypothetical protein
MTFKTNLFNDMMEEIDVFRALMPLDRDQLLHIVRENADEDGDKKVWLGWHIDAAIAIVFEGGSVQGRDKFVGYKKVEDDAGTRLWATVVSRSFPTGAAVLGARATCRERKIEAESMSTD